MATNNYNTMRNDGISYAYGHRIGSSIASFIKANELTFCEYHMACLAADEKERNVKHLSIVGGSLTDYARGFDAAVIAEYVRQGGNV